MNGQIIPSGKALAAGNNSSGIVQNLASNDSLSPQRKPLFKRATLNPPKLSALPRVLVKTNPSGKALAAGRSHNNPRNTTTARPKTCHPFCGTNIVPQLPAASALPLANGYKMNESVTYFITWTTYGTWLPGDGRGWRKWKTGEQQPQPMLEDWCRNRMSEKPVLLNETQRQKVEAICRQHAEIRGWDLHAISVRSNHVHLAVTANAEPKKVRDQFKANATRVLRNAPEPITNKKIWTKGGDIRIIEEEKLEQVVLYITVAQDRMERDK